VTEASVQASPSAPSRLEYLTPAQVSELLQVSEKSLYRWAAEDRSMPVLRMGRRTLRFPRERLERWLAGREQGRGRPRLVKKGPAV
jgi:excisionase family DNA binding protein